MLKMAGEAVGRAGRVGERRRGRSPKKDLAAIADGYVVRLCLV